jgi:hypothetical protein
MSESLTFLFEASLSCPFRTYSPLALHFSIGPEQTLACRDNCRARLPQRRRRDGKILVMGCRNRSCGRSWSLDYKDRRLLVWLYHLAWWGLNHECHGECLGLRCGKEVVGEVALVLQLEGVVLLLVLVVREITAGSRIAPISGKWCHRGLVPATPSSASGRRRNVTCMKYFHVHCLDCSSWIHSWVRQRYTEPNHISNGDAAKPILDDFRLVQKDIIAILCSNKTKAAPRIVALHNARVAGPDVEEEWGFGSHTASGSFQRDNRLHRINLLKLPDC